MPSKPTYQPPGMSCCNTNDARPACLTNAVPIATSAGTLTVSPMGAAVCWSTVDSVSPAAFAYCHEPIA